MLYHVIPNEHLADLAIQDIHFGEPYGFKYSILQRISPQYILVSQHYKDGQEYQLRLRESYPLIFHTNGWDSKISRLMSTLD